MKNTILDSLKSRKFRFGGYATLITVAALAVLVIANLIIDQVPAKADLTGEKLYSLSAQSLKILKGLSTDVTITTVGKVGVEDPTVKEVLSRYAAASRRIKIASVDPELNPGWAKQYSPDSSLQTGSIVVVAGSKNRTISPYSLYDISYDQQTGEQQYTGLSVEQRITSAVSFVTSQKNVTLYTLKGYGVDNLATYGMTTAIQNQNYAEQELDLVASGAVPSDADVVLLLNPRFDLPAGEVQNLRTYLAGGGRMLILLDLSRVPEKMPNLEELLGNYGIGARRLLVVEGNASHYVAGLPYYLLPNLEYHDILSPLRDNDLPLLLPGAMALQELTLKKRSLTIEKLLTTSENSWGKVNYASVDTLAREPGDAAGPFTLALAITDPATAAGQRDTKLIVTASANFMAGQMLQAAMGNGEFFLNGISWLAEKKEEISIRPKSLVTYRLNINELWSNLLSGIVVIAIPLAILGLGLGVWLRRRHL